jgi:hypothetical protein
MLCQAFYFFVSEFIYFVSTFCIPAILGSVSHFIYFVSAIYVVSVISYFVSHSIFFVSHFSSTILIVPTILCSTSHFIV